MGSDAGEFSFLTGACERDAVVRLAAREGRASQGEATGGSDDRDAQEGGEDEVRSRETAWLTPEASSFCFPAGVRHLLVRLSFSLLLSLPNDDEEGPREI